MFQRKKRFQCEFCSATFNDLTTFETHSKLHLQKSVKCSLCNAVFSGVRSMKFHMWKAHEISKLELERNMTIMNWEAKSFPPPTRKKKPQSDNNHILNDDGDDGKLTTEEEDDNDKVVTSDSSINIPSYDKDDSDDANDEKIYKCYRCNKTFKYEFSIAKHLRYHLKKGHLNVHNNNNNNVNDCDDENVSDDNNCDKIISIPLPYSNDTISQSKNYYNNNNDIVENDQQYNNVWQDVSTYIIPIDQQIFSNVFIPKLQQQEPQLQLHQPQTHQKFMNIPYRSPLNKIILTSSLKSKHPPNTTNNINNEVDSNLNDVTKSNSLNYYNINGINNESNNSSQTANGISLDLSVDDLGLVKIDATASSSSSSSSSPSPSPKSLTNKRKLSVSIRRRKLKNTNKVNFECRTCSATFEFDFCYYAHVKQHEVMNEC
ncbi:hypothetical protein HELRODRAFT_165620 [Helobdella robusta]|uniref:C2H2-type domain-containing protein n=1 Tax=Helobdella robusta TaxID=6412 RepID=T1EX32_HELRO|nr:hypothetical protein HELRODRAFT_165620 [Helobdella robusta]ESN91568.1 hypothetical protein HELRODRAFT_165620 [Helobdella robusta]